MSPLWNSTFGNEDAAKQKIALVRQETSAYNGQNLLTFAKEWFRIKSAGCPENKARFYQRADTRLYARGKGGCFIMVKIAPSILSADFSRLGEALQSIEAAGADIVHLDVMDGHFVPNLTFGPPVIRALRACTNLPFDVHLMMDDPASLLDAFLDAGANSITLHIEACPQPQALLARLRQAGVGAALSIKPSTPAEVLYPFLDQLSMVLVMTVEPGFGGQALIADTLEKVSAIRGECERRGLKTDIEVDGGINTETAAAAIQHGANILVAGSAVFGAKDMAAAIAKLRG
ncbi:MAG: ribulose-phosphate 3-epimerase [Ethanoligenens sp.]